MPCHVRGSIQSLLLLKDTQVLLCRTCARDEVDGVISNLSILPELDVGVIEHVSAHIHVVEALRGQNHAHIIPRVEQRQHLQEEVSIADLGTGRPG